MTDQERKAKHHMTRIALVNHPESGADDSLLATIASALQKQDTEHIAPSYGLSLVEIVFTTTPLATDQVIGMFKDADQAGALGYHDTTPSGLPLAKVFPLLDAQDGANLSTTISHELAEMRVDPFLTRCVQSPYDGKFWALEVADAVEQDEYEIGGVKVSNFVLPHYFEPPEDLTGIKFDWLGLINTAYEVRPGGYMQWNSGHGWHQVVHQDVKPRAYRMREGSRSYRRAQRHLIEVDKRFDHDQG